jgi:hypothetical protein
MSNWAHRALVTMLAATGCAIPYPVVVAGGPFEVPPSASSARLGGGARVQLVTVAPPRCRSVGLATGVGGIRDQYEESSDARHGEFRDRAVVALRNAVAEAGGTHVRIDAEVRVAGTRGLTHVIVRGAALAC